jgi:hypothetical protein
VSKSSGLNRVSSNRPGRGKNIEHCGQSIVITAMLADTNFDGVVLKNVPWEVHIVNVNLRCSCWSEVYRFMLAHLVIIIETPLSSYRCGA